MPPGPRFPSSGCHRPCPQRRQPGGVLHPPAAVAPAGVGRDKAISAFGTPESQIQGHLSANSSLEGLSKVTANAFGLSLERSVLFLSQYCPSENTVGSKDPRNSKDLPLPEPAARHGARTKWLLHVRANGHHCHHQIAFLSHKGQRHLGTLYPNHCCSRQRSFFKNVMTSKTRKCRNVKSLLLLEIFSFQTPSWDSKC